MNILIILADSPFGGMPILEFDGKQYCQSCTIARYLAKQFGMQLVYFYIVLYT